jgi:hypothetical protein
MRARRGESAATRSAIAVYLHDEEHDFIMLCMTQMLYNFFFSFLRWFTLAVLFESCRTVDSDPVAEGSCRCRCI